MAGAIGSNDDVRTDVNAFGELAEAGERLVRSGPPPVPFVLAVGVTGHRAEVLPEGSVPVLHDRVRDVLRQIEQAGRDLLEKERDCFAALPPRLRFVSPIADGADQIAAEVALELGWE
jgi:hypothetical protein